VAAAAGRQQQLHRRVQVHYPLLHHLWPMLPLSARQLVPVAVVAAAVAASVLVQKASEDRSRSATRES
jgi:hypothetical protein